MVSRQEGTFYSRKRDITIYGNEFYNSFKKRRQEHQTQDKLQSTMFNERPNSESMRSVTFDFELQLHTPLLLDWHKSIEAKGYSRTFEDHRTYLKEPVILERPKMSLDLELNLSPTYSPSKTTTKLDESSNQNETISSKGKTLTHPSKKSIVGTGLKRSQSRLSFEVDNDDDVDDKEQEMVTRVCMKCHMLVMLYTSTPVCPNCKFMHPHDDHSSTKLFKSSNLLRLLC